MRSSRFCSVVPPPLAKTAKRIPSFAMFPHSSKPRDEELRIPRTFRDTYAILTIEIVNSNPPSRFFGKLRRTGKLPQNIVGRNQRGA